MQFDCDNWSKFKHLTCHFCANFTDALYPIFSLVHVQSACKFYQCNVAPSPALMPSSPPFDHEHPYSKGPYGNHLRTQQSVPYTVIRRAGLPSPTNLLFHLRKVQQFFSCFQESPDPLSPCPFPVCIPELFFFLRFIYFICMMLYLHIHHTPEEDIRSQYRWPI